MSKLFPPTARWNAADYAANSVVQQAWARELIAKLNLRGDERVLDVGCGDGKVSAEIARAVSRGSVVGVDASPQMIKFARAAFPSGKIPNLKFRVMDARKISLAALFSPAPPKRRRRPGCGGVWFQIQNPSPQPFPRLGGARRKKLHGSTLSSPTQPCIGWTITGHFCAGRRRVCVPAGG